MQNGVVSISALTTILLPFNLGQMKKQLCSVLNIQTWPKCFSINFKMTNNIDEHASGIRLEMAPRLNIRDAKTRDVSYIYCTRETFKHSELKTDTPVLTVYIYLNDKLLVVNCYNIFTPFARTWTLDLQLLLTLNSIVSSQLRYYLIPSRLCINAVRVCNSIHLSVT